MFFPETVITGCGNPLYADDGFGPAVIQELRSHSLPPQVKVIDAGTGGKEFVFSLLDPSVTRRLIVVDAADFGGKPGSVTMINVSDLPDGGITDHQPGGIAETLMMLREINEIILVGCQPKHSTYPEMFLGLSPEMKAAIPRAIWLIKKILENTGICHNHQLKSSPGLWNSFVPDTIHKHSQSVKWMRYQFFHGPGRCNAQIK